MCRRPTLLILTAPLAGAIASSASSVERFASFSSRAASPDAAPTTLDPAAWRTINDAKTRNSNWKGVPMLKSPFDSMILVELLRELRPATIIELGALAGGSALFLADQARALDLEPRPQVFSLERVMERLHPTALAAQLDAANRLTFINCDLTTDLPTLFAPELCASLQRPILLMEDAHVAVCESLEHFDRHVLREGDYLVVEDTVDPAKRAALRQFLDGTDSVYAVDTHLCDYFGPNCSWNPDAYLRKMR